VKLSIDHTTTYAYQKAVRHSIQYLRLTPIECPGQHALRWKLQAPGKLIASPDPFGNPMHVMTLDEPHDTISLRVRGKVELDPSVSDRRSERLSPFVFLRPSDLTEPGKGIYSLIKPYQNKTVGHEETMKLMTVILEKMPYEPGSTSAYMSAETALQQSSGVCQDHSHVFISACRELGLPARYVSGYIYSGDDQHVAMHAWCEVWLDGQWQSFDVTNQSTSPSHHLKLAVGLDYLDACPVRGIRFGGGQEILTAVAQVTRDVQVEQSEQ